MLAVHEIWPFTDISHDNKEDPYGVCEAAGAAQRKRLHRIPIFYASCH